MELRENMYVRTRLGIGKIVNLEGDLINIDLGYRTIIDYKSQLFDIINASDKLIDLVDVGDYVNGKRVFKIEKDGWLSFSNKDFSKCNFIDNIVTKEQFEQMSYKVGE